MKKMIYTAMLLSLIAGMGNCKGNQYSSAECEPVINQMLVNFTKDLQPEEVDKLATLKSQLLPMLQKECMSGKYELECLKNATNIASLQVCKK